MKRQDKIKLIREYLISLSKSETININPDYIKRVEVKTSTGNKMTIEGNDLQYLHNKKFVDIVDKTSQEINLTIQVRIQPINSHFHKITLCFLLK